MSTVRASLAASLPGYDLGGELGRGSWGVVRDGSRRRDGVRVAIKELPAAYAAHRAVRNRFVQESQRLRELRHPNLVEVIDADEREGVCVLVMEQAPGGTVWGDFVVNGMTAQRACTVVIAAAAGVHALHQHGIVHRDLKPENLMYAADGRVQVADAGLARIVGGPDTMATTEGHVLGTPAYLAPEQALGHPTSAATDVYALGTILYELLSGALPHADDGNPLSTLRRHIDEPPTPLVEVAPDVPAPVAAVVMRALSRHLDDRQQTADAFAVELGEAAAAAWGADWQALADLPLDRHVVRPNVIGHPVGGTAARIGPDRLIPVRTLTVLPDSPKPLLLGAAAAALVMLLVIVAGLGSPDRGGEPIRLGVADPIEIDFQEPVTITSAGPPDRLAAVVSIAGVDVARVVQDSLGVGGGMRQASFDLRHVRYLVAGEATLTLYEVTTGGDQRVGALRVGSRHNGWLTAPAIGALVLALAAIAYAEAMLAPARRGRIRIHHLVGLGITAALLGVALDVLGWVLGAPEPTRLGATATAATAATGAVLYGIGRARFARRRQSRKAMNRLAEVRAAAARKAAAADKIAAKEAAT
jgi:serine/threonine-protein kinase